MGFASLYNRSSLPVLSPAERERAQILLVDSDLTIKNALRQALLAAGYGNVWDAPNHLLALKKLEERQITHIIFEARKTNMPVTEFLEKALEFDPRIIAIPTSFEPSVDQVFDLLIIGARGYIVKPFTPGSLDDAIVMATKGEPISESILHAKNRNEALAALILSNLDKTATLLRQSKSFDTAKREVPKRVLALKRAVDIGRTFAQGGSTNLVEAIIEFCLDRGSGPATRLGRIRKRLSETKPVGRASDESVPQEGEELPISGGPAGQIPPT